MKTRELNTHVELHKGFKINPELNGKFDKDPFFLEKAEKAKDLILRAGLPDPNKYKSSTK